MGVTLGRRSDVSPSRALGEDLALPADLRDGAVGSWPMGGSLAGLAGGGAVGHGPEVHVGVDVCVIARGGHGVCGFEFGRAFEVYGTAGSIEDMLDGIRGCRYGCAVPDKGTSGSGSHRDRLSPLLVEVSLSLEQIGHCAHATPFVERRVR